MTIYMYTEISNKSGGKRQNFNGNLSFLIYLQNKNNPDRPIFAWIKIPRGSKYYTKTGHLVS